MSSPDPKAALRRSLLAQRRALDPADWRDRSDRLAAHLQTLPTLHAARTILTYQPIRQEPDLTALVHSAWGRDRTWGLPRCVGQQLHWHRWHPEDPLVPGAFGIREPDAAAPVIQLDQVDAPVDALLVPAVGGDRRGYRLGYGGGFYDRLFATHPTLARRAIAITFAFAVVDTLPIDPWDVPLAGLCTETGCVLLPGSVA